MDQFPVDNHNATATVLLAAGLFLANAPRYAQCGEAVDVSELAIILLGYTYRFEAALRSYLHEPTQTRRQLNQRVREFIDLDARSAMVMTGYSLNAVGERLLELEAYEHMDRLERIRKHVNQLSQRYEEQLALRTHG